MSDWRFRGRRLDVGYSLIILHFEMIVEKLVLKEGSQFRISKGDLPCDAEVG